MGTYRQYREELFWFQSAAAFILLVRYEILNRDYEPCFKGWGERDKMKACGRPFEMDSTAFVRIQCLFSPFFSWELSDY